MIKLLPLIALILSASVMADKPSWAGKGKPSADDLKNNQGLMTGLKCEPGDKACIEALKKQKASKKEKKKWAKEDKKQSLENKKKEQ
ncbi:hypothetical protein [Vibrio salinus]|uniref:hypothetical protein n=1 Tax=Vibrio salinus TaxID=2899784 RepID=UPI001E3F8EBA|nr:hypothetical protein [Vibrio salinus]MCE0493072.1 hypothetical protein [Vibrio salinus]